MKRHFLLLAFSVQAAPFSQEPAMIFTDTLKEKAWVTFSAFDYYSSNTFNNTYVDKWLFGGEITSEIKNRTADKLKVNNTLGAEFENGLSHYSPMINPFKVQRLGLMFSFSDNHFASINIPSDLYRTVMYGNSAYVGDTMDFSFGNFQYQHYQKIGLGLFDEKTMSSISLSYIAGSKSAHFLLGDSWMTTNENVDTVTVKFQGSGFATERFFPYWAFLGSGFSIDFDYNFLLKNKLGNRQVVNLRVRNLGAIFWNRSSNLFAVDSINYYSGFDVKDLLSQDSTAFQDLKILDTLGFQRGKGFKAEWLPVELSLQKCGDQGSAQNVQLILGFKAILSADYFPYLYAGAYYKPKQFMSFSSRLSYGGFGGFKWGIDANFWIKKKGYIGFGTFDVIGLVSKKMGYGRGLSFSCSFNL